MVGKLWLDEGKAYAYDIRRAREVAEDEALAAKAAAAKPAKKRRKKKVKDDG